MPETPLLKGRQELHFSKIARRYFGHDTDVLVLRNEVDPANRYGLGAGSPDLLFVVRGWCLFIELKSHSGRVKKHQGQWHQGARDKGAHVETVKLDADTEEGALRAIEGQIRPLIEAIRGRAVAAVEEARRGGDHG